MYILKTYIRMDKWMVRAHSPLTLPHHLSWSHFQSRLFIKSTISSAFCHTKLAWYQYYTLVLCIALSVFFLQLSAASFKMRRLFQFMLASRWYSFRTFSDVAYHLILKLVKWSHAIFIRCSPTVCVCVSIPIWVLKGWHNHIERNKNKRGQSK